MYFKYITFLLVYSFSMLPAPECSTNFKKIQTFYCIDRQVLLKAHFAGGELLL